jgi:hypothetical protein
MEETPEQGIDLNLYSRQIGAFGVEAMGKLIKLRVFVQGMRGVSHFGTFPIILEEFFAKNSKFQKDFFEIIFIYFLDGC